MSDAYSDRQLVPEPTHSSLVLYTALINSPSTDQKTRLASLAKKASTLDALAKARAFDSLFLHRKQVNKATIQRAKAILEPPLLLSLLLDRATTYCALAAMYRRSGSAASSATTYDRAVWLLESLWHATGADGTEAAKSGTASHQHIANVLRQTLDDWADIEQSLNRHIKAERIRDRISKY
ncbi:hypothetical protein GGI25_002523 [Coemansia spiralis]|uniref:Uncharacterized protein n=2 Tax=Coemansia TaxID=4863 RepID=A0A9W8G9V3_9FUNG|nr:hypothetical protein BX070DRAFT_255519 [Coemansia spiralis]KAJ1993033.1 hypothetical protein EDC05_002474 [Coemansia umbellata]KAJ2622913.1 hypothetical protein GGI26_002879 [Coemansia sp. RSA 1358]KAJ2678172.1 hypothetical protein GGI25_002523 [Coemansia spiralis]